MGVFSTKYVVMVVLVSFVMASKNVVHGGGNFNEEFEATFGDGRVRTFGEDGKLLSLTLDKVSGSGFRSKKEYLHGRFDMQMKFVAGDSAGTVTTFYLSSEGDTHDEIDFEFLGNVSGQPYTIHTNVFSQGKGGREQQFQLWFNPTKNFHTYTIIWNLNQIIFLIDDVTIRIFNNHESEGVPFPKDQPMRVYSSLWNADDWATQGGRVKTNWTEAPFTAYYRNYNIDACDGASGPSCAATTASTWPVGDETQAQSGHGPRNSDWRRHELDANGRKRLRWVQRYHMIYDYCSDWKRYSENYPTECKHRRI